MATSLRLAIATVALAACAVTVRDAASYGSPLIGLAVWAVYLAGALIVATLVALVIFATLRLRRRRAPTYRSAALLIAMVVAFPVSVHWSEGETSQGLVPAIEAIVLATGLQGVPSIKYSEGCCY